MSKQEQGVYNIRLEGRGMEIVAGTLSKDECLRIKGVSKLHISEMKFLPEIIEDEKLQKKHQLQNWFDYDDLYHQSGLLLNDAEAIIENATTDETKTVSITKKNSELSEVLVSGVDNLFYGYQSEEGVLYDAEIIIPKGEKFVLKKLSFKCNELIFSGSHLPGGGNAIVNQILYDGKILENKGEATNHLKLVAKLFSTNF